MRAAAARAAAERPRRARDPVRAAPARPGTRTLAGAGAVSHNHDGAEILVVEDDQETRLVLARELAGAGYRVVEADDARTALERFAARRPALPGASPA